MRPRLLILTLFLILGSFLTKPAFAIECDLNQPIPSDPGLLPDYIKECEKNAAVKQGQALTLKSAIDVLNSKIRLTQAQIKQTTVQIDSLINDISSLTVVVSDLDKSLNELAEVYVARVRTSYKHHDPQPLTLFLSSDNFAKFFTTIRYLNIVKAKDQLILSEVTTTKNNYDREKELKIEKQKQVEALKIQLDDQKKVLGVQHTQKNQILVQTQNDEKKFQTLKEEAERELEALALSTFTGKKEVKKGDVIGIMGSTGFSTGPHLHFGYYNLTEEEAKTLFADIGLWYYPRRLNPTDILQKRNLPFYATSCDDVSQKTDKEIGNGSLPWPLDEPVISQCYGHTPYSYYYKDNFHDGLDMTNPSSSVLVKTVDDGVAYFYRGATSFGNNVRIFHSGGKMTLYLHLK